MNKNLIYNLSLIAAVALCAIGCTTKFTRATYYTVGTDGKPYVQYEQKTTAKGLLASSAATKLDANLTYTNAPVGIAQTFSADQINAKAEPEAIASAGEAAGKVIGEAGKALVKPTP